MNKNPQRLGLLKEIIEYLESIDDAFSVNEHGQLIHACDSFESFTKFTAAAAERLECNEETLKEILTKPIHDLALIVLSDVEHPSASSAQPLFKSG